MTVARSLPSADPLSAITPYKALADNDIILGWSEAIGLLDPALDWWTFRALVKKAYYASDQDQVRAGRAAGNLWRFIRDMQLGDLVAVPHGSVFHIGRIVGPTRHDQAKVEEDSAYRRQVEWLNGKKPIQRAIAKTALQSRMTTRGTCVEATDLLPAIRDALTVAEKGQSPTFSKDLRRKLIDQTLAELRSGRLNDHGFETLVKDLMMGLGARRARIVARNQDKGADVVAIFEVAGAFEFTVAVQAKYYQPHPPVQPKVVDELILGMNAESANLGMIMTTGTFAPETEVHAAEAAEEAGVSLKLIDGTQLAALLVQLGVSGG